MTTYQTHSLRTIVMATAVVVALAVASAAFGQQGHVELTPTFGWRWGGEISKEDNPTLGYDAELEDASSYGIVLDLPVSQHVQIELSADHQSTGLQKDELFAPPDHDFDLDVNYYHIGVLGQWPAGHVIPFVSGGLGIADLRPDSPGLSNSQRFSATLGGGIKVPVNDHLAFRLEARSYWSDTSESDWEWDDDYDCHHDDCHGYNEDLVQAQIRVGIVIRF